MESDLSVPDHCLSFYFAQYLMNQPADFNQICIYITFGHDKKLNKFW